MMTDQFPPSSVLIAAEPLTKTLPVEHADDQENMRPLDGTLEEPYVSRLHSCTF